MGVTLVVLRFQQGMKVQWYRPPPQEERGVWESLLDVLSCDCAGLSRVVYASLTESDYQPPPFQPPFACSCQCVHRRASASQKRSSAIAAYRRHDHPVRTPHRRPHLPHHSVQHCCQLQSWHFSKQIVQQKLTKFWLTSTIITQKRQCQ